MKTFGKYLMVLTVLGGLMIGQAAFAAFLITTFTDDAGSGIDPLKTYTHKLDFFGSGPASTINGVSFTLAGFSGANWSWDFHGALADTGPIGGGTGITRLLSDFYYSSTAPGVSVDETLTLSGLTIGTTYEARFYSGNATYLIPGDRSTTVTLMNGAMTDTISGYDQGGYVTGGNPNGRHYLAEMFTAQATSVTFDFVSPVGKQAQSQFGMTLEEVVPQVPEPSTVMLLGIGLSLCYRARRRMKK